MCCNLPDADIYNDDLVSKDEATLIVLTKWQTTPVEQPSTHANDTHQHMSEISEVITDIADESTTKENITRETVKPQVQINTTGKNSDDKLTAETVNAIDNQRKPPAPLYRRIPFESYRTPPGEEHGEDEHYFHRDDSFVNEYERDEEIRGSFGSASINYPHEKSKTSTEAVAAIEKDPTGTSKEDTDLIAVGYDEFSDIAVYEDIVPYNEIPRAMLIAKVHDEQYLIKAAKKQHQMNMMRQIELKRDRAMLIVEALMPTEDVDQDDERVNALRTKMAKLITTKQPVNEDDRVKSDLLSFLFMDGKSPQFTGNPKRPVECGKDVDSCADELMNTEHANTSLLTLKNGVQHMKDEDTESSEETPEDRNKKLEEIRQKRLARFQQNQKKIDRSEENILRRDNRDVTTNIDQEKVVKSKVFKKPTQFPEHVTPGPYSPEGVTVYKYPVRESSLLETQDDDRSATHSNERSDDTQATEIGSRPKSPVHETNVIQEGVSGENSSTTTGRGVIANPDDQGIIHEYDSDSDSTEIPSAMEFFKRQSSDSGKSRPFAEAFKVPSFAPKPSRQEAEVQNTTMGTSPVSKPLGKKTTAASSGSHTGVQEVPPKSSIDTATLSSNLIEQFSITNGPSDSSSKQMSGHTKSPTTGKPKKNKNLQPNTKPSAQEQSIPKLLEKSEQLSPSSLCSPQQSQETDSLNQEARRLHLAFQQLAHAANTQLKCTGKHPHVIMF